jgi:phage/plasmid-like protein (TIGR03299 family)
VLGKPWATIGEDVPKSATAEEVLEKAKLDWGVEVETLMRADRKTPSATGRSIVRTDTREELGSCGTKYVPVQNLEAMKFFKSFCKTGGLALETVGALDKGRHIWAMAKMEDYFTIGRGSKEDKTEAYMLLSHPHQYGKSLTIVLLPRRIVCLNQLPQLITKNLAHRYRMSHVKLFDQKEQTRAEAHLAEARRSFREFGEKSKALSGKSIGEAEQYRFFAALFQPKLLEAGGRIKPTDLNRTVQRLVELMDEQPGAELSRGTWWSALNAVTHFVDHHQGDEPNVRCREGWFGKRAGLKRKALDLALDTSGVWR